MRPASRRCSVVRAKGCVKQFLTSGRIVVPIDSSANLGMGLRVLSLSERHGRLAASRDPLDETIEDVAGRVARA